MDFLRLLGSMGRAMILFPELPVSPLYDLESFLLYLTPGQILHDPVVNVFPVEDVRRQWVFVVVEDQGKVLLGPIDHLVVPQDLVHPPA